MLRAVSVWVCRALAVTQGAFQIHAAEQGLTPGSARQCWRRWDERPAPGDQLGPDFHLGNKDPLYAGLDRLRPLRAALCQHRRARWQDLFGVKYEGLLDALPRTYFEGAAADLPKLYMLLVEIEGVFRTCKNDRHVQPIYHSLEARVEAPSFVSFLAYGLWGTLKQFLTALAPGPTPRQALDQLARVGHSYA